MGIQFMSKIVSIDNKRVGPTEPTYIVAEIGINHNGDTELAKSLFRAAAHAGCDAVKLQKRTIDLVYTKEELAIPRSSPFGTSNGDLKRGLELSVEAWESLHAYAKTLGLTLFGSCWDMKSVDDLGDINIPAYKIPSALLDNKDLLRKVRSKGRPVIISTGMSDKKEIDTAISVLGIQDLIVLYCTKRGVLSNCA